MGTALDKGIGKTINHHEGKILIVGASEESERLKHEFIKNNLNTNQKVEVVTFDELDKYKYNDGGGFPKTNVDHLTKVIDAEIIENIKPKRKVMVGVVGTNAMMRTCTASAIIHTLGINQNVENFDKPINPYRHSKRKHVESNKNIVVASLLNYEEQKTKQPDYTIEFIFSDGFKCYARNQANADRKHKNYLKQANQ